MQTCFSLACIDQLCELKAEALAARQVQTTTSWSKLCSCIRFVFDMYVYSASYNEGRSTF